MCTGGRQVTDAPPRLPRSLTDGADGVSRPRRTSLQAEALDLGRGCCDVDKASTADEQQLAALPEGSRPGASVSSAALPAPSVACLASACQVSARYYLVICSTRLVTCRSFTPSSLDCTEVGFSSCSPTVSWSSSPAPLLRAAFPADRAPFSPSGVCTACGRGGPHIQRA